MIKMKLCHDEAGYLAAMKSEGYTYFLFCGENNIHYNGSKIYLFKSRESAEEVGKEEFSERKRLYKIGKTFFVKDDTVFLEEIHELRLDSISLPELLWKQPSDEMWVVIKSDGTIQTSNDGLPFLCSEEKASQSQVGSAIAKLCHYTADGQPVILEVKPLS